MKVAIVHYWLVGMRGGEKVVESLCRLFPEADIFTHVYAPDRVSDEIRRHRVVTSFINGLPLGGQDVPAILAVDAIAIEQFDLRGYDLIISQRIRPRQRRDSAAGSAACLLLPFAHAIRLEHVSRLSRALRRLTKVADARGRALRAKLGRPVRDAGRSFRREFVHGARSHPTLLRARRPRHSSARGGGCVRGRSRRGLAIIS